MSLDQPAPHRRVLHLIFLAAFAAILYGCAGNYNSGGGSNPLPLEIATPSSLSSSETGVVYSATMSATGGTTPYSWSISAGALPSGLTLSSAGVLSGTPSASGTFNFTVKVTDAAAQTATAALQITIAPQPQITTSSPLPGGQITVAYSTTLAATGGKSPCAYPVDSTGPKG